MKDLTNINNNHEFEDIEQLLQPQCDFHASSQTKKEVMEKARKSMTIYRSLRIFPWICAACVAGIIAIVLQPPKDATLAPSNTIVAVKKTTQPTQKAMTQEKNLTAEKEKAAEMAVAAESKTYEKKKTMAKLNAPKREAKPKADLGDDMPETKEAEGPVRFPMSTLPKEHLFKMQTAEVQATTCNAVQSEDDCLQGRRPERFSCGEEAVFDAALRRVRLHRKLMYGDLVLEDRDRGDAPTELAAPVLAEKVVDGTLKLVKWNDAVEQWIRRLNGLSVWMPELELPRFSEEDKLVAISLVCEGAVGYKGGMTATPKETKYQSSIGYFG